MSRVFTASECVTRNDVEVEGHSSFHYSAVFRHYSNCSASALYLLSDSSWMGDLAQLTFLHTLENFRDVLLGLLPPSLPAVDFVPRPRRFKEMSV